MFSLSTSKRKAAKAAAAQQAQLQAAQQRAATINGAAGRSDETLAAPREGVDELGRVLSGGWRGRSKSEHGRSVLPLSPPSSTSKLPPVPPPKPQWVFSPTLLPPPPSADGVAWGHIPVRPNVVLGLPDVALVVHTLVESLGKRALETPLLFSSLALDVSVPKIKSLIETYLATIEPRPGTSQRQLDFAWTQELTFAGERELAWVLRWALARVLQVRSVSGPPAQGERVTVDEKRGLVELERYLAWRERERANGYPLVHWHAFTAMLGPELQPIFNDLFSLFSRLAAHSHIGGCTPTVLGSLFGPLLFGLPPSSSLFDTHKAFSRSALATEHLLLAFLRSQAHSSAQHATTLPGRLQAWISGYPVMLASDRALDEGRVRPGVKCVKVEGLRRDVRAYSKELFRTGEEWAGEMELPEGPGRPDVLRTWVERVVLPSRAGSALNPASGPRYTADYKKRLHIPAHLPPLLSASGAVGGRSQDSDDDDDERERWRSLSEKQWGDFMSSGFDPGSSSTSLGSVEHKGRERRETISKKLEFDLTEGARKAHQEKRDTLSWHDFSTTGFSRTESTLTESLSFSNPIQRDILQWPEHREEVRRRLKKLQKDLPSFDYPIRPRHVGELVVEEAFVDCWADILISAGWMDRSDPTLREVNWAIVNYKALPAAGVSVRPPTLGLNEDPRTDDLYIFFEEIVPVEYQSRLTSSKKPLGLFSTKRYKKSSSGADSVGGRSQRDKEEEFEASVLRGRPTKMLSLTSRSPGLSAAHQAPYSPYDGSQAHTPATSGSSTAHSTPRKDGIRPTRSAGELKQARLDKRVPSPVMHKVTTKKEAKRIQGASPFDPHEMGFETRIASSDPDGTLRRSAIKGHGKEPSRDDLWIDILVSNGVKGSKSASASPPATHTPFQPPRPSPEQVVPIDVFASQPSTKFYEGASSEVGSLGGSTVLSTQSPSPLAPAIFVTMTTPPVETSPNGSNANSNAIFDSASCSVDDRAGDADERRRLLPAPSAVEGERTKSERLLAALAASQDDKRRHSAASDFTQPDSDVTSYAEEASPRDSTFDADAIGIVDGPVDTAPTLVPTSSYVHGQPLHNLIEEEEEEEEEED